jgi:hypothetical protein
LICGPEELLDDDDEDDDDVLELLDLLDELNEDDDDFELGDDGEDTDDRDEIELGEDIDDGVKPDCDERFEIEDKLDKLDTLDRLERLELEILESPKKQSKRVHFFETLLMTVLVCGPLMGPIHPESNPGPPISDILLALNV